MRGRPSDQLIFPCKSGARLAPLACQGDVVNLVRPVSLFQVDKLRPAGLSLQGPFPDPNLTVRDRRLTKRAPVFLLRSFQRGAAPRGTAWHDSPLGSGPLAPLAQGGSDPSCPTPGPVLHTLHAAILASLLLFLKQQCNEHGLPITRVPL